jgi:hypothetical protein
MNQKYKPPILPEGTEIVIGTLAAAIVLFGLIAINYPVWAYLASTALVYVACVYGMNLWTENDRMYYKSMNMLRDQILPTLRDNIEPYVARTRNPQAASVLKNGVAAVHGIIEELQHQEPGVMFFGLMDVQKKVEFLGKSLPEYIDIQDHPLKAGGKSQKYMADVEDGFSGFNDWATDTLARVNKGDLDSMSINARMLRALRNLLNPSSTGEKEVRS